MERASMRKGLRSVPRRRLVEKILILFKAGEMNARENTKYWIIMYVGHLASRKRFLSILFIVFLHLKFQSFL